MKRFRTYRRPTVRELLDRRPKEPTLEHLCGTCANFIPDPIAGALGDFPTCKLTHDVTGPAGRVVYSFAQYPCWSAK